MPSSLVSFTLFDGLPTGQVDATLARLPLRSVARGDVVLEENTENEAVFLIEGGELDVWKGRPGTPEGVRVARLKAGDCFGEMSALTADRSSATIVAVSPAQMRVLTLGDLPADEDFRQAVTVNLARTLVRRLSQANDAIRLQHERELRTMRILTAASAYITRMLTALAFYLFSLPLMVAIEPLLASNSLISFLVIVIFAWVVLNFLNKWPEVRHEHWHMTRRAWPHQIARGLLWAIPPLLIFLAVKASFMHARPGHFQWFEPMTAIARGAPMNFPLWAGFALVYTLLSFAQEFIRCAVQGTLQMIHSASGNRGPWKAILVSDLMFAAIHMHLGVAFTAQAFIAGLIFGYVFHRERSYLTVAVAHSFVGVWAVFVMGIPR